MHPIHRSQSPLVSIATLSLLSGAGHSTEYHMQSGQLKVREGANCSRWLDPGKKPRNPRRPRRDR